MKFTIAASSLMFAAHSSAHDEMGILVNSHNKKRYLKKDQNFEKQFKDKDTNRNRTKVPRDRPERVQAAAGQVDIAPLQQAVASFVKEEEDPYFGCPPSDIVDCDDGFLRGSMMVTTCKDACDGKCCVGTTACDGFTGKVCKDEKSCIERDACKNADIGLVVGGCNGRGSCQDAYIKHGVIRGCIGVRDACYEAGNSGYVGRIKDGCVGDDVCAYMGGDGGFVGFVDNGCVGDKTCYKLGYEQGARVGFIRNACKQREACYYLAAYDGFVGSVERACIGTFACYDAAEYDGFIGSIKDSCKGRLACGYAAQYGGYINGINKACLAEEACYFAAYYGGSINGAGISKACLTRSSCFGVAYSSDAFESVISSGITNCVCDTCAGALDDASLPDECGDKLDFVGELLDELEDIIKSKIGN